MGRKAVQEARLTSFDMGGIICQAATRGGPMTDQTKQAAGKFSWNPFVKVTDGEHAKSLARDGGAICAGLLVFTYVVNTALLGFGGVSLWSNDPNAGTQIGNILGLVLAAFLGWRIWARQPLWALWFVLIWLVVETASKVLLGMAGAVQVTPFSFFINAIGLVAATQAVRGGMWISARRKQNRDAAQKAGFDI